MAIDFLYPQYEVVRNNDRCIDCRVCERQCANEVHFCDAEQQPHAGGRVQVRQPATAAWRCARPVRLKS